MMTKAEQICSWCHEMPSTTVDNTFGYDTNVYRIADKIFVLVNIEDDNYVTLKALPEDAAALRAQYDFMRPGYYMNKRHWITIDLIPEVPMAEVHELIQESYRLVFEALPKKRQAELDPD